MVWFQCEDCGENLKKPKLPNHFRICSATKLSCIDCGEMFGQDRVQGHTQCITEAEKYGPKGQGKISNGATPKSNKKQQHPDVDITVGLSDRPPWFCSLCNTSATSKQTLLLHADGKKHRAKARAIHAAKQQQAKQTEESAATGNTTNGELHDNKQMEEQREQNTPAAHAKPETDTEKLQSKRKRKTNESGRNDAGEKAGADSPDETEDGQAKAEGQVSELKKAKRDGLNATGFTKEDTNKKIKLKKLIKSALRTNPDGVLKMKKLKKLVFKSLRESGIIEDETRVNDMLEQKINTSSRFKADNKYVRLAAKD
ncbi:UBP1-associated proteins 1C isoform X1 [Ricinus communis]|uniref:UBP1-associated proteins 1C isoform X1 n=2 Tax=Ricinus communis TaxID=3988 RepID=UPI00201A53BB|nr:UBP1-associated proteins 1C isoform X1 [Ricinus communis]